MNRIYSHNNFIKFFLPDGFHPDIISDTLPYMPKKNKVAVYQHTNKEAQIIITKTTVKARSFELPYYKLFYERLFASQNAPLIKSNFSTLGKKKCIRIEFLNTAIIQGKEDDDLETLEFRNIYFVLILRGRLTLLNFSILNPPQDDWDKKIEECINSFSIRKSWFPSYWLTRIKKSKKKRKINLNLLSAYSFFEANSKNDLVDKNNGVWHQPFFNAVLSLMDIQKKVRIQKINAGKLIAQFRREKTEAGYHYVQSGDSISSHAIIPEGKKKFIYRIKENISVLLFWQKPFVKDENTTLKSKKKSILIFENSNEKLEMVS